MVLVCDVRMRRLTPAERLLCFLVPAAASSFRWGRVQCALGDRTADFLAEATGVLATASAWWDDHSTVAGCHGNPRPPVAADADA